MNFADFWQLYPRKVSKREAEKAWNKCSLADREAAIEALPLHIKYWQLKDTSNEFIPHASTWLNQARFEDELDMTESQPKKPKIPFYATDELTIQKGREINLPPLPGESMGTYRQRIHKKLIEIDVGV